MPSSLLPRSRWPFALAPLVLSLSIERAGEGASVTDVPSPPRTPAPVVAPDESPEVDLDVVQARRLDARRQDGLETHGRRDARNLSLDEATVADPDASSTAPGSSPLLAVDGDPATAWRGAPGPGPWVFTLPFRRVVHLGLLRAHFGDAASRGTPASYRWEVQPPVGGQCVSWGLWQLLPGGKRDDDDGDEFLFGPHDAHAQKQALFADADACSLRLVVDRAEGQAPVLRELRILESAPSVARSASVAASPSAPPALLAGRAIKAAAAGPAAVVDGGYGGFWKGEPGAARWSLTLKLPAAVVVDRLRLVLGLDAAEVEREGRPGRDFSGAYLPTRYSIATSWDDDPRHLVELPEGAPPLDADGDPLPVRRRLVRFDAPRPVRLVRLTIHEATGPDGQPASLALRAAAPVVREIGLYAADDPRPVVSEPLFLSVDANPSALTDAMAGHEAVADGLFARAVQGKLRRIVAGVDDDTGWHVDPRRPVDDASRGRFLEVIEGDDPALAAPLLEAMSPPPVVMLSGSLDWDYAQHTSRPRKKGAPWGWNVVASADEPDRGMGQLRPAVRGRSAPFIGFCGGAQILALLEAEGAPLDQVLLRNDNRPLRGERYQQELVERAWWFDPPGADAHRPEIRFDPVDPLFDTGAPLGLRASSKQIALSHVDMIRASAFTGPLARFLLVAESEICRPWVSAEGLEPTRPDTRQRGSACVRVPQAFRSRDNWAYPVVGFQFHPEQRELGRLAPGQPQDARGDALNVLANAVDRALDAYARLYWPDA